MDRGATPPTGSLGLSNYLQSFLTRQSLGQFLRLGLIGGFNAFVDFALLNLLFFGLGWSSFWSVTWALAFATSLSYAMNRRWTFGLGSFMGSAWESATFFIVSLAAWALNVGVVSLAERSWGPLGALEINFAKVVATGIILLPKFATYRDVVFRRSLQSLPRS